jgi:Domain of unknown function (DUF4407)
MSRFLINLAGARPQILDQCPTERLKFQSLGWAILITSGIATVSMWFALYSAMGINPVLAFFIAVLWGLVIMGIDRWLVTSIPPRGSRRWQVALPRVVLAVLLGSLISTPIVLRLFQSEINTQISVIKQQRASAFLSSQQHSAVSQQVTSWTNQVASLEKVINSGGQQPLDPSADPVVKSLTSQKNSELALEQKYYTQWQCQLYGGSGCPRGNGVLAQASEQNYNQAVQQVAALTSEISQRENALSAQDKASQQTRYEQAVAALPAAQAQLKTATAAEDALRSNFEANNSATNGLLIRLQALNELSGRDFTLNSARLLIFLFFLVIECLPITVKLMQQPGNYEKILEATAERELKDARRRIRSEPGASAAGAGGAAWAGGAGEGGSAPAATGRLPQDPDLEAIWRRPSAPGWADVTAAEEPPARPGLSDEATQIDSALRNVRGAPATTGSDGRGGSELRFKDDDL